MLASETPVEIVDKLKYLGVTLQNDYRAARELLARIEVGRRYFFGAAELFHSSDISCQLSSLTDFVIEAIAVFDRTCLRRVMKRYMWSNDNLR